MPATSRLSHLPAGHCGPGRHSHCHRSAWLQLTTVLVVALVGLGGLLAISAPALARPDHGRHLARKSTARVAATPPVRASASSPAFLPPCSLTMTSTASCWQDVVLTTAGKSTAPGTVTGPVGAPASPSKAASVAPAAASAANPVAGARWTVPLQLTSSAIARPAGGVEASGCSLASSDPAQVVLGALNVDGATSWTQPYAEAGLNCSDIVIDPAGNTYFLGPTGDGSGNSARSVDAQGHQRWSTPLGDRSPSYASPVVGANGNVYFAPGDANNSGTLVGLSGTTGSVAVNIASDIYLSLHAYGGGIAAVGIGSNVDYLNYQGQVTATYSTPVPQGRSSSSGGADGTVFVAGDSTTGVSNGDCTFTVTKVTPAGVAWSWSDPRPSLCGSREVAASPDGGVIVGHGLPASSDSHEFSSLDSSGHERWHTTDSGAAAGVLVDANGVAVLQNYYSCATNAAPDCVGLRVSFASETDGAAVFPSIQATDPSASFAHFQLGGAIAIASGTVYVPEGAALASPSMSAFSVTGLAADYQTALQSALVAGGSGSTPPPPPPPPPAGAQYAGLGDSYSSGEGNAPFLSPTDTPRDKCHRSALSYSFVVGQDLGYVSPFFSFHACSGAVIGNFYSPNAGNNEPRQLQWLGPKTRLATLTIGGNDAHFADVIQSCFESAVGAGAAGLVGTTGLGLVAVALSACKLQWNARVNAAIGAMGNNQRGNAQSLAQLYGVVAKDAPNARILVVGYPRFFPASPPNTCATGAVGSFSKDTMVWIDQEILKMDQTIKAAVGAANAGLHSSRVQYVDAYNALSGHERCTADPWLNGIIRGRSNAIAGSFHPNSHGHRAIATLVEEAYNNG